MLSKLKFSYSAQVLLSKVFMVFYFNISPVFKRHRHLSFLKCDYVNMVQYPSYIFEGDLVKLSNLAFKSSVICFVFYCSKICHAVN